MEFSSLPIPACKKFSGYKPCLSYKNCLENGCQDDTPENRMGKKILIISLDALGNVLYNTPLLFAIKRKYPESTIYWLTLPNAEKILQNNPLIDHLFLWTDEHRMILRQILFDYVFNGDKSDYACAFTNETQAKRKLGFLLNADGKIVPANESAMYSYQLGIDDRLKFRENTRSGVDIAHEVFELEWKYDPCIFEFSQEEKLFIESYKSEIGYDSSKCCIGLNTGCSTLFPNKKMTVEQHVRIINELGKDENIRLLLLGGREDTERNDEIFAKLSPEAKSRTINTPSTMGIRRGACFMNIADVVISGDSFGMHLALALRKYVIVWFGLSCQAEIELYNYGQKLFPEGLECSPCWKKTCPRNLECIDMIDLDKVIEYSRNFADNIFKR